MIRYVVSPHVQIESGEGDSVVMIHNLLGHRLRLNRATQRFLDFFKLPLSLEDLGRIGPIEAALPTFRRLLRARYLIEEGHRESYSDRRLRQIVPSLLGCPFLREAGPLAEVVFLGVPLDCGNTVQPGARFGPGALRRVSQVHFRPYDADPRTGRPGGWFDNDRDEEILAGISLADGGDLFRVPNEAPATTFSKLREIVAEVLAEGGFPVVLGGDHSITYPILAAFKQPLEVLQVDAHTDLADYMEGEEHHHGNFMSRVMGLNHVTGIHQVGIRGITPVPQARAGGKVRQSLTPRMLRRNGVAAFVDALPADRSYYVTFDIDSLDPLFAPATSTPLPGGLTFEEVKDLLVGIAFSRACVGFDIVEVNPERDVNDITLITAMELLLAFLGAHFRRRQSVTGGMSGMS